MATEKKGEESSKGVKLDFDLSELLKGKTSVGFASSGLSDVAVEAHSFLRCGLMSILKLRFCIYWDRAIVRKRRRFFKQLPCRRPVS